METRATATEKPRDFAPGSSAVDRHIFISFVSPAYHDQDNIARVVSRGVKALRATGHAFEWIIVNDGSPDRTGGEADALSASHESVTALHHPVNLGHGAALDTGIGAARGQWIGFCDGDDQYDPRDIALLLRHCDSADVIIGRRTNYPNGAARAMLSWAFNAMLRWLFDAPYRDLGCAFKMFRRDALCVCGVSSRGIFMQCEMALRAHRAGLRVVEVPIPSYPRTAGQSSSLRMKNVIALVKDVLSLFREFHHGPCAS